MAKKSMDQVKSEIRALVAEVAEIELDKVTDSSKFNDDLGVDSMKALEIVAMIEKKNKIVIPEDKIPAIRTLNDVYAIIEPQLK